MTSMEFAVFDQQLVFGRQASRARVAATESVSLCIEAEQMGADKFWVAEHHGGTSGCAAPEVLASAAAARTTRIVVGTAALLVPYNNLIRIVGMASLLESLYPERIELGLGRGPGALQDLEAALLASSSTERPYESRVEELLDLLQKGFEYNIAPSIFVPPVRLMGASSSSAVFAARLGIPYCFASFIHDEHFYDIADLYRSNFVPSAWSNRPSFAVAVRCAWSDDTREYEALRTLQRSISSPRLSGDGLPTWTDLRDGACGGASPLSSTVAGGKSVTSFDDDVQEVVNGYAPDLLAVTSACPVLEQRVAIAARAITALKETTPSV